MRTLEKIALRSSAILGTPVGAALGALGGYCLGKIDPSMAGFHGLMGLTIGSVSGVCAQGFAISKIIEEKVNQVDQHSIALGDNEFIAVLKNNGYRNESTPSIFTNDTNFLGLRKMNRSRYSFGAPLKSKTAEGYALVNVRGFDGDGGYRVRELVLIDKASKRCRVLAEDNGEVGGFVPLSLKIENGKAYAKYRILPRSCFAGNYETITTEISLGSMAVGK